MSKKKSKEQAQADEARQQEASADEAGELDADAEAAEAEAQAEQRVEQDIDEALSAVERERDELHDRLLRTAADYQNYVRRAEQHADSARQQQVMEMARALLSVLDHFDRAVEADPQQTTTEDLLSGVKMVRQELLRVLAGFGIERLDVEPGEPFDPNHHEALMRQASEQWETNAVTAQLRPGYKLGEKTVRPAQVSVAE